MTDTDERIKKVRDLLGNTDPKLVEADAEWHEREAAGQSVGWTGGRHMRAAQELRALATVMRAFDTGFLDKHPRKAGA